jgi:hypothetical protein
VAAMSSICRICGQPLAVHTLEFVDGTAHAVGRDSAGRRVLCSLELASHYHLLGEIEQAKSTIRSLKNRAGRAYRQGHDVRGDTLWDYIAVVERRLSGLLRSESWWHERYPLRKAKR